MRGKLFWVSLLLFVIAGAASGSYLEGALRRWLIGRVHNELVRHASAARVAVELTPEGPPPASLDPVADRLGEATSTHICIISEDGRILGDSERQEHSQADLEDQHHHPEVRAALAGGVGTSQRLGATTDSEMLYVALGYRRPTGAGVVRSSMSLGEVDEVVNGLRLVLVAAGILGLIIAVFGSGLASHLMSRALVELVERARRLALGRQRRIEVSSKDEIGRLAGSFNRLARELDSAVSSLAEERIRLQAVLEGMSEAVVALDSNLRITLMNPAALGLLQVTEDAVGRMLVEAVRSPRLHELASAGRVQATADEFPFPVHDGRQLQARATPLSGDAGVAIVLHDVTELRRLETVRSDFVANVSHELRTPVSVIRANAETLLDGALEQPSVARTFLQATVRNSDRLSQLIADLLDLASIEAGSYRLELESTAPAAVALRVAESLKRASSEKNSCISISIDAELRVRGDEKALEQVLTNLIDNALKYSQNGAHVDVRAQDQTDDQSVRIEVIDDGPGIAPQHRERIFERFYRVDAGRSRELGGTGLGLSIVRHLVDTMGGSVGVEPARPRGARFWFTLPRATA
ncbi:MAG: ATP-binding protein [Proteobacteria bacterium]|nr:ATP-binding protein [Pseudomonadota bacterium]